MKLRFNIFFSAAILALVLISCTGNEEKNVEQKQQAKQRVFEGYHVLLDEIVRSKDGIFRGVNLNSCTDSIKHMEVVSPTETSSGHLYYEYAADSITNYSIDYTLENESS